MMGSSGISLNSHRQPLGRT
jgi:hypothetical protein